VDICMTIIKYTEFRKCEKLVLNSNWWTLWATHLFHQKVSTYFFTKKECITVQCTALKYSTHCVHRQQLMLPDSSTNFIIALIRNHCFKVSKSVVKSSKPNAFSRLFLIDFVYYTGGSICIT